MLVNKCMVTHNIYGYYIRCYVAWVEDEYHNWHLVGQATPICNIGGAGWAAVVCLVCSMWSSGRYKDFIKLTGLFSLDCLLLEASIAPYLSATQLESQRLWRSCKSTPKPTKQAIPAWLVAPEICLKLCLKTLQCWSRRAATGRPE